MDNYVVHFMFGRAQFSGRGITVGLVVLGAIRKQAPQAMGSIVNGTPPRLLHHLQPPRSGLV